MQEKKLLKISMFAGITFVIIELVMSIFSKSQAVLMDAVYDGSELIMIIISIKLLPLLYKPISEKRPYGYAQMESIFVLVKSFMMLAVTIGLVLNNLQIILDGGKKVAYGIIAYFELFAAILSVVVIFIMKKANGLMDSPMIKTEINGWTIDAISSIGMAIAFFTPVIFKTSFINGLTAYLDQIVAILLALFVIPYPIKFIITSFRDMFLFAPEPKIMNGIKENAQKILVEYKITDTMYDVIRTGRKMWICIYFKSTEDLISVCLISKIQKEIENSLMDEFGDVYVELLPDID